MTPNLPRSETQGREQLNRRGGSRFSGNETQTEGDLSEFVGELNVEQLRELLCQALETEVGGVQVYETALRCAQNEDLKEEWQKYLEETQNHERILTEVFERIGLDPDTETPGRAVVRHNGESLVKAMEMALENGNPELAQTVAAECVVLAETKDHFNWQLIGQIAGKTEGELRSALEDAYAEVEEQEDEHLYHTKGWARELWFEGFGLPAQLPPPEEEKDITSQIGAARVQKARKRAIVRGRSGARSGKKPARKRTTGRKR